MTNYQVHLKLAKAYLIKRKRQSLIAIMSIALGVTVFIIASAILYGNEQSFISQIIDVAPHVLVYDQKEKEQVEQDIVSEIFPNKIIHKSGFTNILNRKGIKNAYSIMKKITHLFHNTKAAPALYIQAFIRHKNFEKPTELIGILPEYEKLISNINNNIIGGNFDSLLKTENGIIIGKELANDMKIKLYDIINVISSSGKKMNMRVVGMLNTGVVYIDFKRAYVLLKKAQQLDDFPNKINRIQLSLQNIENSNKIANEIQNRFLYKTESWQKTNANVFNIFKIQSIIMNITILAIMIVASFGIYNVISTIVFEKFRDIAILKSIGFTNADIQNIYIIQGVILSFTGVLIGWALGGAGCYLIGLIKVDIVGFVKSNHLIIVQKLSFYVAAAVMGITACVIASYLSIRKTRNLNPVDIIRNTS